MQPPRSLNVDPVSANAKKYVSPYGTPQAYVELHASRSPSQPYVSPYDSPSPVPSDPQAQEQSLPVQMNFPSSTTLPIDRATPTGTMDPPLAPPSSSKGAKRALPTSIIPTAMPTKKFKGENYYNNSDRLLENGTSPLYKDETNVKMILQHPLAQTSLPTSQDGPQLPETHSDEFASAAADFKEDGRSGRHEHDWVGHARAAARCRRLGGFDQYDTEHFKKYWAMDSRELSEDEDGNQTDDGCHDDNDNKFKRHDRLDDDDDAGGSSGGKTSGFGSTYPAPSHDCGNGYSSGGKHGGNSSSNGNDSKYGNTCNHDDGSKNDYASHLRSSLPTPPITPVNSSFDTFHSPIKNSSDGMRYYPSVHDGPVWKGMGYCDNPHSVYPLLD